MSYKGIKKLIFLCATLFVISSGCFGMGYYKNKNIKPIENNTIEETKITYKYQLENEIVSEMPTNPTSKNEETNETIIDNIYIYDGYSCENGTTGEFNTDTWEFIPNTKNIEDTCTISFMNFKYEVSFLVISGLEDENNPKYIERLKDGEFKIIPNEGYIYSKSECNGEKKATYDTSKNILKISAVNSDISCKVYFVPKKVNFSLTIKDGHSDENDTKNQYYYGDEVKLIVYPNDGYEFKKGNIKCTNKQEGTFESNTFSIDKLTSDTKCTLSFSKMPVVKHKLTIKNINNYEDFSITSGDTEQKIEDHSTGEITIGYTGERIPDLDCGGIIPDKTEYQGSINFKWLNVTKDITCEVKVKKD